MAQAPKKPADDGSSDFVRSIVTDPKNVPDVMRLYGYPGASSEEGHERLYLSPDLTSYVEVPKSTILHRMEVPAEQDPHGAVVLWVKRDAPLIYKMAPAAQALAHYFAGAIQGAAAAGGVAAGPVAVPAATGPVCGHTPVIPCTPGCPTPVCGNTPWPNCTHNAACKTPVLCTFQPVCPPHHTNALAVCPPISWDCAAQAPVALRVSYYGFCSPACGSGPFCPTGFLQGCGPYGSVGCGPGPVSGNIVCV
jgi:hypothetical protein